MEYGICYLAFIPLREEPAEQSEMVSQILFGEYVEILQHNHLNTYSLVKNSFDRYEGWCNRKHLRMISQEEVNLLESNERFITRDILNTIESVDGVSRLYLGAGSTLYPSDDNIMKVFDNNYIIPNSILQPPSAHITEQLIASARIFLNVPYLWGGRSSFGTDCSGFVQNIYKQAGIPLPRDAKQQALCGTSIPSLRQAKSGDLIFFKNNEGNIVHTGIYSGKNRIIHASGRVREDPVDQKGIYNREELVYSHKLASIKRILS